MEIVISYDGARVNRLLLALERLDQEGGIDPALAELRNELRQKLIAKATTGSVDSASSNELARG